jgi:hypothetical protein
MVLKFVCCVVIDIIDFLFFKRLMQNTYLLSLQIGMPQANALNSIGYTDTVRFLTIGKPDIYLLKSLGESATVFIRVTNNYQNWLPTYLIFSAIDIQLANIWRLCIYRITNSQEEYCIRTSYRFWMHLQAAFLFAKEIGKFFALMTLDLLN